MYGLSPVYGRLCALPGQQFAEGGDAYAKDEPTFLISMSHVNSLAGVFSSRCASAGLICAQRQLKAGDRKLPVMIPRWTKLFVETSRCVSMFPVVFEC